MCIVFFFFRASRGQRGERCYYWYTESARVSPGEGLDERVPSAGPRAAFGRTAAADRSPHGSLVAGASHERLKRSATRCTTHRRRRRLRRRPTKTPSTVSQSDGTRPFFFSSFHYDRSSVISIYFFFFYSGILAYRPCVKSDEFRLSPALLWYPDSDLNIYHNLSRFSRRNTDELKKKKEGKKIIDNKFFLTVGKWPSSTRTTTAPSRCCPPRKPKRNTRCGPERRWSAKNPKTITRTAGDPRPGAGPRNADKNRNPLAGTYFFTFFFFFGHFPSLLFCPVYKCYACARACVCVAFATFLNFLSTRVYCNNINVRIWKEK